MTLQKLVDTLFKRGLLVESQHKSIGTTTRVFTRAVGLTDPKRCPVSAYYMNNWKQILTEYINSAEYLKLYKPATPKVATTHRYNMNSIFKKAVEAGLLEAFPVEEPVLEEPVFKILSRKEAKRIMVDTSPYKDHYALARSNENYGLPLDNWPKSLKADWERIRQEKRLAWRNSSANNVLDKLEHYVGFLINILGKKLNTFDEIIDLNLIDNFISWHAERVNQRVSVYGEMVLSMLLAIARHSKHPDAENIAAYKKTLPQPIPLHDDRYHDVSLKTLDKAGDQMIKEARLVVSGDSRIKNPGITHALKFQYGLIIKFLCRHPIRPRNIREMKREKNFWWQNGEYYISFVGDELKIATRKGRPNVYEVNLTQESPELEPLFREFMGMIRPRFPNSEKQTHIFLNRKGAPLTDKRISEEISIRVFQYTRARVSPQRFRHLVATTLWEMTGNAKNSAVALGDDVITVQRRYVFPREKAIKEGLTAVRKKIFSSKKD